MCAPEEKMQESADSFIASMTNALGEGVAPPMELDALRKARASGAGMKELATRIYELMIERGMLYDEEPETGTLTPTEFDIKSNLDVTEVKDEFFYLYKYGMMLALDDMVMTTINDEFHYHEMISHVPMFAHGNAKNILVIGAGDRKSVV